MRPALSTSRCPSSSSCHWSYHPFTLSPPYPTRSLSDGANQGGSTPLPGISTGATGVETTRMSSTGSLLSPARGAATRPPSPSSRAENSAALPDRQGVQGLVEEPQAARAAAADPTSAPVAGNATSPLERPPVQLYRVPSPGLRGSPGELRSTDTVGQTGPSPDRASAARTDQSPSTMGAIFDAIGTFGGSIYDPRAGVSTVGGAGGAGTLGTGGGAGAGRPGLLRFTALLNRELLQHVSVCCHCFGTLMPLNGTQTLPRVFELESKVMIIYCTCIAWCPYRQNTRCTSTSCFFFATHRAVVPKEVTA